MEPLQLFVDKMRLHGIPELVIEQFGQHYTQLCSGIRSQIPERTIEPLDEGLVVPREATSLYYRRGIENLGATVVIKLNGGLGTTMGLDQPKSLLEVREGKSFLDCIMGQLRELREQTGVPVPLLFMNSPTTDAPTRRALESYSGTNPAGIPQTFQQHLYPRIDAATLLPAHWERAPHLEWNPPGHGDLYSALATSGLLDTLIHRGIRYAFVSNCDNLGALLDPALLGFMDVHQYEFMMEAAVRSPADVKGGHLALSRETAHLVLREYTQCPESDRGHFVDIARHRFFNTNNLWIDLAALQERFTSNNPLQLALIVNPKNIDPGDRESLRVLQLETAMGSAVSLFETSCVIGVGRDRFIPVKSCRDLLAVRSDCYTMKNECVIEPREGSTPLTLDLDPRYYASLNDLALRFPHGVPSLRDATSLTIRGDVRFGAGVRVCGEVVLDNSDEQHPRTIPDGTVLSHTTPLPAAP